MQLYCKKCGGTLYEADTFKADDDQTYIEIGCYNCPHKIYPTIKVWKKFMKDLEKEIARQKDAKRSKTS